MNSGDRGGASKDNDSGGLVGPPESGTSRYAVGLVIPRPVARLQSRTPLHQAEQLCAVLPPRATGNHAKSGWNDGFVASRTGPGDRTMVPGVRVRATVEEMGRPGTRLRRIASGRKQTRVPRPEGRHA